MGFYKHKLALYNSSGNSGLPLEDRMIMVKNDMYRNALAKYVETSNAFFNFSSTSSMLNSGTADVSYFYDKLDKERKEYTYLENVSVEELFATLIAQETQEITRVKFLELENIKTLRSPYMEKPLSALRAFVLGISPKQATEDTENDLARSSIRYGFYSAMSEEWRHDLTDDEKISYIIGRYEIDNACSFDAEGIQEYIANKVNNKDNEQTTTQGVQSINAVTAEASLPNS